MQISKIIYATGTQLIIGNER